MKNKSCLYCYLPLTKDDEGEMHTSCSQRFFGFKTPPLLVYSLKEMDQLAVNIIERSVAVPGVQPKLSLSLVNEALKNGKRNRLTVVGALGGNYIFKPPSEDYPELPQNEHLTMRMAEAFGIRVVPSSLIRLSSGELSFITKRIDRTDSGRKIHMIDFFQITEAFDKYKSSMEKVGKAIDQYSSQPLLDKLYFFEIALFSFLTGNNDMHLKNFSMILSGKDWVLSPAYDLLNVSMVNPNDNEEMALTIEGKKRKLKREYFDRLAEGLKLNEKQINSVFKRFQMKKEEALHLINQSFLSKKFKNEYRNCLLNRFERMKLE
jgi:serine/threonine-protein kinase HipA